MKKLIILIILILFVPILFLSFGTDGNVYLYMGRLISESKVPYIDGWDHKGISLYVINAIGYVVFGFKSIIGVRILEFLLIGFTFLRVFNHLKSHYSKLSAVIATSLGLFTFKYFFDGGNMTEEYGVIFVILSSLLLLKKHIKTIDYAIIGAFFIINITIRANLIAFWVALFLTYLVHLLNKKETLKIIFSRFLKIGYGVVSISILLLIYLFSTNSFFDFLDAAFTFNFSYSKSTLSSTAKSIVNSLVTYRLSIIFVVGFLISLFRVFKKKGGFLELLLLFWIPIEIYFTNISNRLYAHYFLMWVPLIIFSTVIIVNWLQEKIKVSNFKILIGTSLFFVLCFYSPVITITKQWKKIFFGYELSPQIKTANYVSEFYQDKTILIWGNACDIYNLNNKFSPVSFFYQSTFKFDTQLIKEKINQFVIDVKEKKPQIIIDTKRSGLLELDESNYSEIDKAQTNNLKEFVKIIKTDYVLKEQKFGFDFYTLK